MTSEQTQVLLSLELSAQYPFARMPASVKVLSQNETLDAGMLQSEILGRIIPLTTGYGRLHNILDRIQQII